MYTATLSRERASSTSSTTPLKDANGPSETRTCSPTSKGTDGFGRSKLFMAKKLRNLWRFMIFLPCSRVVAWIWIEFQDDRPPWTPTLRLNAQELSARPVGSWRPHFAPAASDRQPTRQKRAA